MYNFEKKIELSQKQKDFFGNLRGTWFDIVAYFPEEDIINTLNALSPLAYALCTHDRDIDENGKQVKIHTHIVVCFTNRRRATPLCNMFNTYQVRVINVDYQLKGSFDYLTHKNETNKVKYENSKLYVFNQEFFNNFEYTQNCKDNSLDIITKLICHVPLRELIRTYGRDFVIHYKSYRELAFEICRQEKSMERIELDCD